MHKKDKKTIVKNALEEAVRDYDFSQTVDAPLEELIEIEGQPPTAGIMNLKEIAEFIDSFNKDRLVEFNRDDRINRYIQDDELKFIHNLLDDRIINALLSYHGYTPSMRVFFPSQYFRSEPFFSSSSKSNGGDKKPEQCSNLIWNPKNSHRRHGFIELFNRFSIVSSKI
jgi:hypothetical protein